MQESNENTHAAPKLVNRPSPHTLPRPCGPGPRSRQDVTKWSINEAQFAQTTAQKRKQNHANTRAHHKTSSKRKETVLCRMSVNASTLQRTWHDGRYLLFSTMLQPTLTRNTNGKHVLGTAQDADKEAYVRGREELRQNTRRTDASEHQLAASSPKRTKKQHKENSFQRCANTKQDPQGT